MPAADLQKARLRLRQTAETLLPAVAAVSMKEPEGNRTAVPMQLRLVP